MKTLREALVAADRARVAIGHFNVSDLVALKAVTSAARALDVPVLIGVSEGEREFMGARQVAAVIASLRAEHDQPVYLNADHTHSLSKALEAARASFDMIVYDGSALPLDENVRRTREAVQALKSVDPGIVVEGELGYIGASSAIHTEVPRDLGALTTPDEAREFVAATGIDVLAPAVGTMHGLLPSMVRGDAHKRLDVPRIAQIKQATAAFLTLHGGSGTDEDDFRAAIAAGITVVHVNTEIRVAWRRALEAALVERPEEVVPYKILPKAVEAVERIARARLQLFSSSTSR